MYPGLGQGNRAFLYSDPGTSGSSMYFPFRTEGTHYVYVQLNEYILVASSAQGIGNGSIRITSPSGVQSTTAQGNIGTRTQEVAGPRYPGQAAGGNRYLPYSFQVTEAGIWKIEFIPPRAGDTDVPDVSAVGSWTQRSDNALIAAWDISVRNAANSGWKPGRVYANVFNLRLSKNFNDSNKAYYGINYVLTKDGRAYRVKNNGNNGYAFTFFSNNKGFIDASGNPTYKSQNTTAISGLVKDPRTEDDNSMNLVTHKLFYGPPSPDLPVSAPVAISGTTPTTTWLKNAPVVPLVTNISFTGSEGTLGQASQKGGIIMFETNVAGTYRITIPLGTGKDRVLNGAAVGGQNSIVWDGKDGLGNLIPGGLVVPEVRVRLASAEVHFPFIDMEINPQGIIIELTENTTNYLVNPTPGVIDESVYSDRVYWDDSSITGGMGGEASDPPVNITDGTSSNSNGHKWGTYNNNSNSSLTDNNGRGEFSYGNEKSMDTYAYILSREEAQPLNVNVKVADLKVVSVTPSVTGPNAGAQVSYTVVVKNAGGSDVTAAPFQFKIPNGLNVDITGITRSFSCATGAETTPVLDANGYSAKLDLPNGCEATYTITGTTTGSLLSQNMAAEASIMRPKDVTDPDATNTVFDLAPQDPHNECLNGTGTESCNNIKYNTVKALEFCAGSVISPFYFDLAAGGTNYSLVGVLPGWLSASVSAGKVTFNGTAAAGLFSFTIGTAGNDREKTTYLIKVNPVPVITSQPVSNPVCEGTDATYSVTSSGVTDTYKWQYEDAGTWIDFVDAAGSVTGATTNTLKLLAIPLSFQGKKIRVVVFSGPGCSLESAIITVTVNQRPGDSYVVGNTNLCEGSSIQLQSSVSGAPNYQWYLNGSVIVGAIKRFFNVTEAGKYSVAIGNASGCFGKRSDEVTVVVVSLPDVPTITYDQLSVCEGNTVKLTSSDAAAYQWYLDNSPIDGATNKEYIAAVSGDYSVLVKNAGGCFENSSSVSVVINTLPAVPTIIVDADKLTICDGGSVILTSSSAAGNQWYKGTDLIAGATGQTYAATEAGIYTVKVTNASGCFVSSASKEVIVNALPVVPTIIVDADKLTFCEGGSVTLTSSAASGNQWYKGTDLIAGATGQTYVATEAGVYTVRVTNASGCFVTSASKEVVVNALPVVPTIIVDADKLTFCDGSSVLLTSSAASGNQWYKGTDLITGATGQTYTATEAGLYTVRVTNASGCFVTSASKEVVVNALPAVPTIIVDADKLTFCDGGSVILTSSAASGNQWYKGTDLIAGATAQTYVATEAGVYTVKVTNASGCFVTSASKEVVVNALPAVPTIIVDADKLTFCDGGSVTLTSSAASGNQWYKGTDLIAGATAQTYVATEAGIYTVKVTNASGCFVSSASKEVIVNALPVVPTIIVDADKLTFCDGGSVTLTSSAASGNQWYKGTDLITGATGQTYTATEAGLYTVRVTNASGCFVTSASKEVVVNALPLVPTIVVDADKLTFCDGGSVVLTSSSATGNQWYKGIDLITGATGQTYTATEAGVYTVRVTNASGCFVTSASKEVIVNALPVVPTIIVDADKLIFCDGGSVILTSSSVTGNQWYKGTDLITGATGQTYTATEAGLYTVRVTNASGCFVTSASKEVVVNALPAVPTIIVDADRLTFCDGGSVVLTSSSATGNQWYKGIDLITGATGQTYTATETGMYTVRVTNASGCFVTSASKEVVVNALPAVPTIIVDADKLTFCDGSSVLLTSSAASGNQWYKGTDLITGATGQTYTATEAGLYTVRVTNASGCFVTSASKEVVVNALPAVPTIVVDADKLIFCDGGSVVLTSSSAAGNQWYKGTDLIAGATGQTYVATEAGVYTVKVTNASGCFVTSVSKEVVVNALPAVPTIVVDADKLTFCDGGSVILTSSSVSGNQWYKGTDLITGATGQTYTATEAGLYIVRVTNASGCFVTSASKEVVVNALPVVPTIIVDTDKLTFCDGGSVVLTSSSASGNQWYKGIDLITGATGQTYTATEAGLYTVRVSNASGCFVTSASKEVVVNALPVVPTIIVDADKLTFCDGGSVILTSSSVAGNQWYKGTDLIAGATAQTYVATEAGIYTVKVTNVSGCFVSSASKEVIVNALPVVPTIVVDADKLTFCEGGSVTLTSSAASGNQWYKGTDLIGGASGQTYVAAEAGVYTVKVTNASGCFVTSTSKEVVVNALPVVPTIIVDADKLTFCDGGSVTLTSSAASGNQWYKGTDLIAGASGQTYVATEAGVYTVKVTNASGCFVTSASKEVVVNALPLVPTIIVDADKLTFCDGGSVILTSSAASGNQWYKGTDLIAGATGQTYMATEAGVYTVKVTNASGCFVTSASKEVVVNALPAVPTIIVDADKLTFCDGGSVILTSSSVTGNQWYNGTDLIAGATGQTYVATEAGVYTVKVTNASGCFVTSASKEVVVNALPVVPTIIVDADKLTFCDGGSVILTSSSASGNQWYKGTDLIAGATGQTYTATEAGLYTVRVSNASGCFVTSASKEVVVNALPMVPTIIVDADKLTFCDGGSVVLTSSAASGNQWYKGTDLIAGATGQTYVATEAGIYTVNVTNASGCFVTSASKEVVVNALPAVPTIIVDADRLTFCDGGSVILTSSSASGNQWYKGTDLITGATGQTYTATEAGLYTVRVTNASGCFVTSVSKEVVVNALPLVPTIIVDADKLTFCDGGSVILTSSSATGNQWYRGTDLITGARGQTYTATEAGLYTVRVTNASGCFVTSASKEVVVNALPAVPTIIVDADKLIFCDGGSVILTSSSVTGNQWYKGTDLITGATGQTYTATEAGLYTVRVTNASGCFVTSASKEVVVNALPLVPTIIVDADKLTFCDGGSVILTSSSASGNQWYKGTDLITGATGQTYTATEAGLYTVRVTNASGCFVTSASKEVIVNALPVVPTIIVDADKLTFCDGGSVILTSSAASGNQWYKGTDLIAGATGQTYVATEAGVYTVKVTNASGCFVTSASKEVVVNALPAVPTIIVDADKPTFCDGGSVILTSSSASGNQWYKGTDLITGATGQTYTATEAGLYTVRVTNASGCFVTSASKEVIVNALPVVPTIIVDADKLTFCDGGSVILTSSSVTGNQWYKGTDLIAGATAKTYVATEAGIYTVKVTNASGCFVSSASKEVVVNALPTVPTIVVDADKLTFCEGGSVTLTSSSVTGNQWYKGTDLIAGATGQTYVATEAGIYTVKVTNASGCFVTSTSKEVVVNALPAVPTIVVDADKLTFCDGGSVVLTSSSASGNQWYKGTDLIAGATGQTYVATEAGLYTVKVTNASSCFVTSASKEVVVNALPVVPTIIVDADKLTFCEGGSVTLTSSSATANQWYKGTDLIAGATGQTYVATEAGIYTVKVTNASGCFVTSASKEVIVNALPVLPTIIVDADKLTFCEGGSVTLTSSAASGNQWYKGTDLIAGATGQTYVATEAGVYTVKVTNASGCFVSSASKEVIVNALPAVPTIIVDADKLTFCDGGSVILTSSASTGNQWYLNGTAIPNATQKMYTATASGSYTVIVTNTNGCANSPSLPVVVTEVPFPAIPNISPAGATTFCEGGIVVLTSSSANDNQWYKNGILIPGATRQTLNVNEIGNYTVKVTNSTGCASGMSALTNVTVNKVPKGYHDQVNSLNCNQSTFTYNLQANVNNTSKGGNSVPAQFSWTASSTQVTGVSNGSGKTINATLINTSTVAQNVVYTITPVAETGGCAGQPFNITVVVPVCVDIAISKTADISSVSAVGDKIKYTITVYNNGNANHSQIKVQDPMLGGVMNQPQGDNGNGILEKNESWIYQGTYIITQNDLEENGIPAAGTGKIINTATVTSLEYSQSKSATATVAVQSNPAITLVKSGVLNLGFKTVTYTFKITNTGNVTLHNLVLIDPKISGIIVLKQTTLSPGASTTAAIDYIPTQAEKVAGAITNTATVKGFTKQGVEAKDISGTAANNDDPTVTDITRYPVAIDDYAATKAEEAVAVLVVNNDRPALFPLNVATVDVKKQPANGVLSVTRDGKVVYQPNKGFFGIEKFTYKIDDANGLSSNIAEVRIDVAPPPLEIPNTFTPNGDGKNDSFIIKGMENYEAVSLFVYNRWGDEVYRNGNYKNEWNGNGLNDGTYFYVLKMKKGKSEETRRSWVLIKR
uniref:DUF7507 domain-containing protein n=1 Tax=Pedobacter schmidteae TaxID=2201271 RepID=UPI0013CEE0EE|nr:gliding motility-associated C-terminal domain-containing protein [Pedobacter schmidteae]